MNNQPDNQKRKNHIILNPIAGKGAAEKRIPELKELFDAAGLDYSIHLTDAPGHAIELAEQFAREENAAIIAAGGDGTSNEVLNGLMRGKGDTTPIFGVLPLGRGNDFSYGCGVPSDLAGAVGIIAGGETGPIDVGLVTGGFYPEGRYFGNGIGVGFDTVVGLEAAKMKHVHDAMAYVLGALKTLIKFSESPVIELSFNGKTTTAEVIQISLMNGNRMGGLFFMAPDAVNSDGKLDLCMVSRLSRGKLMKTIIHYTKGTQKSLDWVTTDQSGAFGLKALKGGMIVHADGETICTDGKELQVECIPGPLRILKN
jgi:YegS/Rv2252/BmrU family lipid kinase